MQYEPHEFCLAFPEMPLEQFRRLSEDIKVNGLLHEIVLYEGKILDGRHRYRACLEHGIEPTFTMYLGKDPAVYVASENVTRRHLSASQLGVVGARLSALEAERAKKRMEATLKKGDTLPLPPRGGSGEKGETAEIIGKKLGIGANTVQRGIKVVRHGVSELVQAVERNEITVTEGARIAELQPHSQRRVVAIKDGPERRKQLGTTLQQSRTKKMALKAKTEVRGDAYVPGTPYVKRFLARAEQMLNDIVAECRSEDAAELADRFMREMDWSSEQLRMQYQHCEKLFACIGRVHSGTAQHRAA